MATLCFGLGGGWGIRDEARSGWRKTSAHRHRSCVNLKVPMGGSPSIFRETRRDRRDDLKVEMQVVLSQIQQEGFSIVAGKEDDDFQRLKSKSKKPKYKV